MTPYVIHTDGCCWPNPGPGGYAAIVEAPGGHRHVLTGGRARTTNNRMELLAAIVAIEAVPPDAACVVHSDSQYVIKGVSLGWAHKWRRNGWYRRGAFGGPLEPVPNADLWARLLDLVGPRVVTFLWVKGHDGNELNEECDRLAAEAARADGLPIDEGFGG